MPKGDLALCERVRKTIVSHDIFESEVDEQHSTKFAVKRVIHKATFQVFNTGSMVVQGKTSPLKEWLTELKESILSDSGAPGILPPAEIEKFPQTLLDRVPACDGVVVWFFTECLRCYKANSVAGSAFMLGAASEKLILLLIDTYGARIDDTVNRERFLSRINSRIISVKFDEFKKSHKSSKPRPTDAVLSQDLDQILEGAFNFYRSTRNQVGHPQVIPDLDKGVILANIGQFITYAERVYGLIAFFNANNITV